MQSDDPNEHIRKLITSAMEEREEPPKTGFTFSREINLGHMVVTLGMMGAAFMTFLTFHDSNLDHSNRVSGLEKQQARTDETLTQLTRNQVATEKAVTQLTFIIDEMRKKP